MSLIDKCTQLRRQVEILSSALATWANRDDSRPEPEVRRVAQIAIDTIDATTRALYRMREELVGQIHESDRASMERADRLLKERREQRKNGTPGGDA